MNHSTIIQAWNNAFFAGKEAESANYLSEDFVFTGPAPEPLNKEAYMGMMHTLKQAFPDLNNNLEITGESGDTVKISVQMAGTHTRDFDLSAMNMPVIPATDKSFHLPKEQCILTLKNGKITKFDVAVPEGGGLKGILTQIGVHIPS